jgi:hypothetical protein
MHLRELQPAEAGTPTRNLATFTINSAEAKRCRMERKLR